MRNQRQRHRSEARELGKVPALWHVLLASEASNCVKVRLSRKTEEIHGESS